MKKNKLLLILGVSIVLISFLFIFKDNISNVFTNKTYLSETSLKQDLKNSEEEDNSYNSKGATIVSSDYEVVARDLNTPWSIVKLDEGSFLISERGGIIKKVEANGKTTTIASIEEASEKEEGGLLGLALHPDFSENNYIYMYLTYVDNANNKFNKVLRAKYVDDGIEDFVTILDKIPGAIYHNGGRIIFGPDKNLYIATGDARNGNNSQDLNSLAGKILRVDEDGKPLADNPYGNEVYSYGHRNVQGLAFDNEGQLWATEHGRSGALSGLDELNLIKSGKNYGWPDIEGSEEREGMIKAIVHSGADTSWAPSGATFLNDYIYFVGLRGEALYQANIRDIDNVEIKEYFKGEFGRLRDVVVGDNFSLYIISNNTDGRGELREGDDKLIKINLK